jgi:hypothetical protein
MSDEKYSHARTHARTVQMKNGNKRETNIRRFIKKQSGENNHTAHTISRQTVEPRALEPQQVQ